MKEKITLRFLLAVPFFFLGSFFEFLGFIISGHSPFSNGYFGYLLSEEDKD